MGKSTLKIGILLITVIVLLCSLGCAKSSETVLSFENISYRDIPGITAEEIEAIEALKAQYPYFTYLMTPTTEAFINEEGEAGGFAALFSAWLSRLFGITFEPIVEFYPDIVGVIQRGEYDFSGDIRMTDERRQIFFGTDPIALRSVVSIRLKDSPPLAVIEAQRTPRYIFLRNNRTIDDVEAVTEPGSFESIFVDMYSGDTYPILISGEADALIAVNLIEVFFTQYEDLISEDFLPLVFNPVSMTTGRAELEPIISAVQKALDNGAFNFFNELYYQGYRDYQAHALRSRFSEEEREFIQNNPVIPLAAKSDNYPVSFFNSRQNSWQGISFDVLKRIEELTGLSFIINNNPSTEWSELMRMLEEGEALIYSDLVRMASREERYIWPDSSYLTDQPALISGTEYRNIMASEVYTFRIGLSRDSGYTTLFRRWFPDHRDNIEYETQEAAFEALIHGEVDMVMSSVVSLLWLTNYLEHPDYKVNLVFNQPFEVTFGLYRDAEILRSIIEKSLHVVDTESISGEWLRRTFDYRYMMEQARRPFLVGAIILSLTVLGLVFFLFVRSRSIGKQLEKLVKQRTNELEQRTEEAHAASNAKSEFLAKMSHEIRTPMNSIMGFAELASDSGSVSNMKDYMTKITDSTKWLLNIINDILDISKIEAGKMELDNTPFNLYDIFYRCQSVILPMVKEKGLELSVYTEPSIGKKLIGDPLRLYQVLINLLSNAVKFTNTGSIKFSSSINSVNENKTTVYFEVKDTGIGMSREQIEKVFGMFIQADSSTTRDYGGTGLGLAISKNIVELMGGILMAESVPGEGSTFSFELSFDTIDSSENITERSQIELSEIPYFEGLVLVCDDNSLNRQVICAHLDRVGLKTVNAENGKAGVEMVQERKERGEAPFDLVFMDMFMPVMDGLEAAARIISLDTGTPIIAMTANVMVSELEKYKRSGMPDCLGKPFTANELWQILLKYLTPIRSDPFTVSNEEREEDNELQKTLCINFYKENRNVHKQILEAVEKGDTKLAHRLAHSLKGNAGLIGKNALKNSAEEVEYLLKDGLESVWKNKMTILETDLLQVLEELRPIAEGIEKTEMPETVPVLNREQTLALFDKLKPMLESYNTASLEFIKELHSVGGAQELIGLIENFEFASAAEVLDNLRKDIEG